MLFSNDINSSIARHLGYCYNSNISRFRLKERFSETKGFDIKKPERSRSKRALEIFLGNLIDRREFRKKGRKVELGDGGTARRKKGMKIELRDSRTHRRDRFLRLEQKRWFWLTLMIAAFLLFGEIVFRLSPGPGTRSFTCGIGIAEKNLDKIFEIFFTLNPNAKKGKGMGLAIVRLIIEQHKGRFWVKSELGKGSTFTIALPVR